MQSTHSAKYIVVTYKFFLCLKCSNDYAIVAVRNTSIDVNLSLQVMLNEAVMIAISCLRVSGQATFKKEVSCSQLLRLVVYLLSASDKRSQLHSSFSHENKSNISRRTTNSVLYTKELTDTAKLSGQKRNLLSISKPSLPLNLCKKTFQGLI